MYNYSHSAGVLARRICLCGHFVRAVFNDKMKQQVFFLLFCYCANQNRERHAKDTPKPSIDTHIKIAKKLGILAK